MKIPGKLRTRALLFSLLGFFLPASLGAAEPGPKPVKIKIDTILASNQNGEFDSRLRPLEKQLKVLKYRSYRLLKEESQNIASQSNGSFQIPGGRMLIVSPQDFRDQQIALKVRLQGNQKPLLDTTLKLQNKGNFILGGPPHEGGVLVLAIWATVQ
ncbi:MAG TPA: hypothetical protein VLX11_00830 [Candidatus Acidoferrales bacterium]|nr:hypothetical protein [Candidatus Acidoferrales bacterium]